MGSSVTVYRHHVLKGKFLERSIVRERICQKYNWGFPNGTCANFHAGIKCTFGGSCKWKHDGVSGTKTTWKVDGGAFRMARWANLSPST
jgi:hypothetical protein